MKFRESKACKLQLKKIDDISLTSRGSKNFPGDSERTFTSHIPYTNNLLGRSGTPLFMSD